MENSTAQHPNLPHRPTFFLGPCSPCQAEFACPAFSRTGLLDAPLTGGWNHQGKPPHPGDHRGIIRAPPSMNERSRNPDRVWGTQSGLSHGPNPAVLEHAVRPIRQFWSKQCGQFSQMARSVFEPVATTKVAVHPVSILSSPSTSGRQAQRFWQLPPSTPWLGPRLGRNSTIAASVGGWCVEGLGRWRG